MKTKIDYTGKTIFLGIDVHKKTYAVVAVCDDTIVKRDTIPASPEKLVSYLEKYFPGAKIKSAYEAGFSGYRLHRYLEKYGIQNIVVHAASIEISANNKVKTDKRDALKIAMQLSTNRLKGIYVPTEEEEDNRELTRLRATLVKERSRVATRIKQKMNYYGLIGPKETAKVSEKWLKKKLQEPMGPELRFTIETFAELWKALREKIKEVDSRMKEQAMSDESNEKIYRSVKGIGPTASRTLSNELGDLSRFASERDLFSYVGLTPSEYSSGEHRRQGHITRQGRALLRKILVECSWVVIRYDKELAAIYERIAYRAGGKRAIVGVARRLIGRLRACFRENEPYRVLTETAA